MAGIEPASERFDPRISTSVAGQLFSPGGHQPARLAPGQSIGPESPLSHGYRRRIRHSGFVTPARSPARKRDRQTWPFLGGQLLISHTKRREGERSTECDWHFGCVLSLRDRYLSARNPGPASSVEACHPRYLHYTPKRMVWMQQAAAFSIQTIRWIRSDPEKVSFLVQPG